MRKDIEIHIKTGDVAIDPQNTFKLRDFQWVENSAGLSRYIYGEIDIPATVTEASIRNNGFYFTIPYTPKYKEFMVRVKRVYENGSFVYLANQTDGSDWFVVKVGMYGGESKNAYASELITVSESSYYGKIDGGVVNLYSCDESDFNIVSADRQNANCLLACLPTNNYRYPLTGVGLVRWVNANNLNSGDLAEVLAAQFEDDGVIVNNASYNYETKQIDQLELDASNAE